VHPQHYEQRAKAPDHRSGLPRHQRNEFGRQSSIVLEDVQDDFHWLLISGPPELGRR
jgi:hypothetical protein